MTAVDSELVEVPPLFFGRDPFAGDPALDADGARMLTARIQGFAVQLCRLLLEAHSRRAWAALGYSSFEEYCRVEFDYGRSHAYRLIDQAKVILALAEAAGVAPEVIEVSPVGDSEAVAREVKPVLEEVAAAVAEAVADLPVDDVAGRAGVTAEQVAAARERTKAARAAVRDAAPADRSADPPEEVMAAPCICTEEGCVEGRGLGECHHCIELDEDEPCPAWPVVTAPAIDGDRTEVEGDEVDSGELGDDLENDDQVDDVLPADMDPEVLQHRVITRFLACDGLFDEDPVETASRVRDLSTARASMHRAVHMDEWVNRFLEALFERFPDLVEVGS